MTTPSDSLRRDYLQQQADLRAAELRVLDYLGEAAEYWEDGDWECAKSALRDARAQLERYLEMLPG